MDVKANYRGSDDGADCCSKKTKYENPEASINKICCSSEVSSDSCVDDNSSATSQVTCSDEVEAPTKSCCSTKNCSITCGDGDSTPTFSSKHSITSHSNSANGLDEHMPRSCSTKNKTTIQSGCCSAVNGTSLCKNSESGSSNKEPGTEKDCCSSCAFVNPYVDSGHSITSSPQTTCNTKVIQDTLDAISHGLNQPNPKRSPCENEAPTKRSCSSEGNTNPCVDTGHSITAPLQATCKAEDLRDISEANPAKSCSEKEPTIKTSCCSSKQNSDPCVGSKRSMTPLQTSSTCDQNDANPKKLCCENETAVESSCSSKNGSNHGVVSDSKVTADQTSSNQDVSRGLDNPKLETDCCEKEVSTEKSCCSSENGIKPCIDGDSATISAPRRTSYGSITNGLNDTLSKYYDNNADYLPSRTSEVSIPLLQANTKVFVEELRVQTTKLRVQNICCPKESNIADGELSKLDGVKWIKINTIGRVVYVSHHPDIVSPTELMVALNKRHLGASIVDTGAAEEVATGLPRELKLLLAFLAVQAVLLGIALGAKLSHARWYMWVAIAVTCLGILPVLKKCLNAIRFRHIDLNILITITVIGTLIIQEWIEGAAVVFVFRLANFLQQFCFYRVQKAISSLMLTKPSNAVLASTGECVPIEQVPVDSIIAVRQGELIPLDGIVVKGTASVDESSISGEAVPVEKTLQSQTYSGTVIQHGYLELKTTSTSTSSTMSKIATMVEEAQMNVSPMEIMVNKFAQYYTPLVVLLAALVFLFPLVLGLSGVDRYKGAIKIWVERALIVLVTACPCALLMATPIVVICGISGGARLGTLIKGGTFLEALSQLSLLAFDKTGTLTEGKFQVVDLLPMEKDKESDVLRWAAALESKSSHPLAAAVVKEYSGGCIAGFAEDAEEAEELLPDVNDFQTIEGQGISGIVEGHRVDIGNYSLLKKLNATLSPQFEAAYEAFCSESKTVVFVCVDRELALIISLADIIRVESYSALEWLQGLGVHLAMLTGDSKQTAIAVQNELKLDSFVAEMKPDDKLEWITEVKQQKTLRRRGCFKKKSAPVVGMVGDGVNDGPALAAADVGIAMAAGGSALAVEAAGVALMTNSVTKVPEMICLSRFCRRIIVQNIMLSVFLKLVFVVVALSGFVRVWMAVLADLVGLAVVIVNGLRPLKWKPPRKIVRIASGNEPLSITRRKRAIYNYRSVF